MKSSWLVRWGMLLAVVLAQVLILVGVRAWTNGRLEDIEGELFAREAPQMKARAELFLDQAYLAIHSIARMPPVRAIRGGNRTRPEEDPVRDGRFSAEGAFAVQQLYNHIASTIPVSEVYGVMAGFRPGAGESPIFTYDQLITGDAVVTAGAEEPKDPDEPEELEGKSFSIVAAEIRSLADHTSMATQSIDLVVEKILQDIASTATAAKNVSDSLAVVAQLQERIASSADQQRYTASEVARSAEESVGLASGIESEMRKAEDSAVSARILAGETIQRSDSIAGSAQELVSLASSAAKGGT